MNAVTCYCCDQPAVGQGDHVPPIKFFPKGAFANSKPIIVPSCRRHNEEQSAADEYLKIILSGSSKVVPGDVLGSSIRALVRHIRNDSKSLHKFGITRNNRQVHIDRSAQ